MYDVGGRCSCFIPVPGRPVPEHMPYAGFFNDTTLWEWKTVELAGFWEEQVYDLKAQYKDTIVRNDGSTVEVPVWIKNPQWRKKE